MAFSSVSVVTNSLRLRRMKIANERLVQSEVPEPEITMTIRQYKVDGMMCKHCVGRVERALNSHEDIEASVTLDPPVATVTFKNEILPVEELQKLLTEKAGDYQITE